MAFDDYLPRNSVSIHAPREGCDLACATHYHSALEFQFTHPGRGATQKPPLTAP